MTKYVSTRCSEHGCRQSQWYIYDEDSTIKTKAFEWIIGKPLIKRNKKFINLFGISDEEDCHANRQKGDAGQYHYRLFRTIFSAKLEYTFDTSNFERAVLLLGWPGLFLIVKAILVI